MGSVIGLSSNMAVSDESLGSLTEDVPKLWASPDDPPVVPEFPETLEGFKYKFNDKGQLRHIETGEPFIFNVRPEGVSYNQRRYEALGEIVTEYVFDLLENELELERMDLPVDALDMEAVTFLYMSPGAMLREKAMILVHGDGVVRAGQWSRKLIINEGLDIGSQIPFIKRAMSEGYGVFVMNTNQCRQLVNGKDKTVRGCSCPEEQMVYVWDRFILPSTDIKHVFIVAHSYGGMASLYMLHQRRDHLEKFAALALTDSAHNILHLGGDASLMQLLREKICNWVSSDLDLDEPVAEIQFKECKCVSAGTTKHEETSWKAFHSIFKWFDEHLKALEDDTIVLDTAAGGDRIEL
ncbi:cotranscriptional regulator ARB2A-like [Tubulanus polymorphus]|uniref:cotranscriptional regulator ARB2A-like n=1 Tax=Tubulanus polymorphus TaxID=672921 RepID=UPI003DA1D162